LSVSYVVEQLIITKRNIFQDDEDDDDYQEGEEQEDDDIDEEDEDACKCDNVDRPSGYITVLRLCFH